MLLPMTRETLKQVGVVTIKYADGSLSLQAVDAAGQLQAVNLGTVDAPCEYLQHFATRYIAPRGTTQLVLEMLSVFTGQPFVMEDLVVGSPYERHIRQDLVGRNLVSSQGPASHCSE